MAYVAFVLDKTGKPITPVFDSKEIIRLTGSGLAITVHGKPLTLRLVKDSLTVEERALKADSRAYPDTKTLVAAKNKRLKDVKFTGKPTSVTLKVETSSKGVTVSAVLRDKVIYSESAGLVVKTPSVNIQGKLTAKKQAEARDIAVQAKDARNKEIIDNLIDRFKSFVQVESIEYTNK